MGAQVNQFISCCGACTNAEGKDLVNGMWEAKPGIFYAENSIKAKIDKTIHSHIKS